MTRDELRQKLVELSSSEEVGYIPDEHDQANMDQELASMPDNVFEALLARIEEMEADTEQYDATAIVGSSLDVTHISYFIFTPLKEQEEAVDADKKADAERAAKEAELTPNEAVVDEEKKEEGVS